MNRKMTLARLARKVDWEGGVEHAIRYGIRSAEIADAEVAALWRELEELYAAAAPSLREVEARLRQVA